MKMADVTERLSQLGGAKWEVHFLGRVRIKEGHDVIEMTIGEPDVAMSADLIEHAADAMRNGRICYSDGQGEINLRQALADHYTQTRKRPFEPDNILCFPGTQTALYAVMMGICQAGDAVMVGDPMYATYEGVVRSTGAEVCRVPLRPEAGFRLQATDIEARVTEQTRAILLNSPHNPTGAILSRTELKEIGEIAKARDLWIVADEVYEHLVFDSAEFDSILEDPDIADRVIGVSSISKSHAAPGFRSGWCVGPTEFCEALLPLAETMLFGNQPFIADMTERAIREGSDVASGMCKRFAARSRRLADRLHRDTCLRVHMPHAGMFALIDVSALGVNGHDYAVDLLMSADVCVMPGSAFGAQLQSWVRIALTVGDDLFDEAIHRIVRHANRR